jgi:hypothetical protein
VKIRTIGLALAVTCLVAAGSPALAQIQTMPPGAQLPPPGPMVPPGGQMIMPPGGYSPMPGGAMGGYPGPMGGGYPGPMMGGYPAGGYPAGGYPAPPMGGYSPAMTGAYPGMPPVMPYPPAPSGEDGGCVTCGCCEPSHGDACCCGGCPTFGRYGGCHDEACCCPVGDGSAHWRARIEPLLLTFDLPKQPAALTVNGFGDLGGIQNMDFDMEFMVRLSLEGKLPNGHSLEAVLLPFLSWSDNHSAVDPALLQSAYQTFNGLAVVPYDNANQHDYAYRSNITNFEFNYWAPGPQHRLVHTSLMFGGRYIHVGEEFDYNALAVVGGANVFGTTNIEAENHLFALQLGLMAWVPIAKHVSVRFDGKWGTAYNFGSQETAINTFNDPVADVVYSEEADSSKGAFLGELSVVFAWQINCSLAVYGGYQGLWLDELVLAPENFNSTFPTAGFRPVLIDDTSSRLYHGVLGGVEITW